MKDITLRDYFAARIATEIYQQLSEDPESSVDDDMQCAADVAYRFADVMMKAREA